MKKFYSFMAMMLLAALSFTAKAATATVYIDNPQAVAFYVYYGKGWDITPLNNSGETPNIIEFDEATCQLFEFDPQGSNKIYQIKKNGADIDLSSCWNGEGYELAGMKDGDVLNIVTNRPGDVVTDCNYFILGVEAIASIENADTEEHYTVADDSFTAHAGDRIVIRPKKDYNIKSATIDFAEELLYIPASGCYFFVAKEGEHMIVIEAEDITSLDKVSASAQPGKVYNLVGVEVKAANLPAGIYIVDGKKKVIK